MAEQWSSLPCTPECLSALQVSGLGFRVSYTLVTDLGLDSIEDLAMLTEEDISGLKLKPLEVRKLKAFIATKVSKDPSASGSTAPPAAVPNASKSQGSAPALLSSNHEVQEAAANASMEAGGSIKGNPLSSNAVAPAVGPPGALDPADKDIKAESEAPAVEPASATNAESITEPAAAVPLAAPSGTASAERSGASGGDESAVHAPTQLADAADDTDPQAPAPSADSDSAPSAPPAAETLLMDHGIIPGSVPIHSSNLSELAMLLMQTASTDASRASSSTNTSEPSRLVIDLGGKTLAGPTPSSSITFARVNVTIRNGLLKLLPQQSLLLTQQGCVLEHLAVVSDTVQPHAAAAPSTDGSSYSTEPTALVRVGEGVTVFAARVRVHASRAHACAFEIGAASSVSMDACDVGVCKVLGPGASLAATGTSFASPDESPTIQVIACSSADQATASAASQACLKLDACNVLGSESMPSAAGLRLSGSAAHAQVLNSVLKARVQAEGGAQAELHQSCFAAALAHSLLTLTGAGTRANAIRCAFVGAHIHAGASGSDAVAVDEGAQLYLDSCKVSNASQSGIKVIGKCTKAIISHSFISGSLGNGVELLAGASVQLSSCTLQGSHGQTVCVHGEDSKLTASKCLIQSGRKNGVHVVAGGVADIKECVITHNALHGLVVSEQRSSAHVTCSVVSENEGDFGVLINFKAAAVLEDSKVDLSRKGSIAVEHSGTSLRMLRVLFDKLPRIYDDTCKVENVDALQYMSLASASAVAAARVNPALHEVGTLAKNAGASIKEFFKEPPANVKNVFKDPGSSMKGMFKDAERGLKGVFEKGVFKRGDKDAAGAASAAATTANVAAASTSQPVAVMTGGSTEPCAAAEAGVQPTDAEPTTTPTNLATTSPMPVSAAAAAAAPAPSPRTSQPGSAWPTTISAAEATSRFAGVVRAAGAADVGQWGADVPVAVDAASKLP